MRAALVWQYYLVPSLSSYEKKEVKQNKPITAGRLIAEKRTAGKIWCAAHILIHSSNAAVLSSTCSLFGFRLLSLLCLAD